MKKILTIIMLSLCVCVSCSSKSNISSGILPELKKDFDKKESDFSMADVKVVESRENYSLTPIAEYHQSPGGISMLNDKILVTNCDSNTIDIWSKDGVKLSSVGKTGNGEGEFLTPKSVSVTDNKVYVLDAGNNRVQIFDTSFQYLDKIDYSPEVKKYKTNVNISSILADDNGNFFLSSPDGASSVILKYSKSTNGFSEFGKNIYGTLGGDHNDLYLITIGTKVKGNSTENSVQTGYNYLYKLDESGLTLIEELPFGITPSSILKENDEILFYTASYNGIIIKKIKDNSFKRIPLAEQLGMYISFVKVDENTYFITSPFTKKLYILTSKNSM